MMFRNLFFIKLLNNKKSIESKTSNTLDMSLSEYDSSMRPKIFFTWAIASVIVFLILLISFAEIDQVTRANAQIVATDRLQIIQSLDYGVINNIYVKEGNLVKRGDLLATLKSDKADAALTELKIKIAYLKASILRLNAQINGWKFIVPNDLLGYSDIIRNQSDLYKKIIDAYDEDMKYLKNIRDISARELEMNILLSNSGDIPRSEVLRLQKTLLDIESQISNRKNKFLIESQTDLARFQEELNVSLENLRDKASSYEQTDLISPADGVINSIKFNNLGSVVRPADTVMELSPTTNGLTVEAKVSSADIGFLKIGNFAKIKIDAFDSSIFGSLNAVVYYISPDSFTEDRLQFSQVYYKVRLRILDDVSTAKNAKKIILKPGMTCTAEILGYKRTILSYLFKPVIKTIDNSFGEK